MEFDYSFFINLSMALFFLAAFSGYISFQSEHPKIKSAANILLLLAFAATSVVLGIRWKISGHIPLSNTHETLLVFIWLNVLLYSFLYKIDKNGIFLSAISMLNVIGFAVLSLIKDAPRPLVPALQSNWLTIHVAFMFFSYTAFALSFLTAIIYFLFRKKISLDLEGLIYKLILFGFPLLTLGIFTGAVWANNAWGTYWSWDPKETWSLITWMIYAIYLHSRKLKGWRGNKSVILSLIGFAFVLFTYFGVNYLLSGLHSYS